MNDWVELNLPYYKHEIFVNDFKLPNLDKRAKKELGFNRKEMEAIYETVPKFMDEGYDKFEKSLSKFDDKLKVEFPDRDDNYRYERAKRLKASSNKNLKTLGTYLEMRFAIEDWENKQPEMIAYDKDFKEKLDAFQEEQKKISFTGLGLNKPGTLIEVKIGDELKQYLIGDINPICGVCDDCTEFDSRQTIVVRYKVVWSNETA